MSAAVLVIVGCMVVCVVAMGAMGYFMGRGMRHDRGESEKE